MGQESKLPVVVEVDNAWRPEALAARVIAAYSRGEAFTYRWRGRSRGHGELLIEALPRIHAEVPGARYIPRRRDDGVYIKWVGRGITPD